MSGWLLALLSSHLTNLTPQTARPKRNMLETNKCPDIQKAIQSVDLQGPVFMLKLPLDSSQDYLNLFFRKEILTKRTPLHIPP